MTISPTSRYASSTVVPVTDPSGVTRPTIVLTPPSARAYLVQYYTWAAHDRPDTVAYRMYGSEQLWWLIADANPEILNWLRITAGTVIRIPQGVV